MRDGRARRPLSFRVFMWQGKDAVATLRLDVTMSENCQTFTTALAVEVGGWDPRHAGGPVDQ
jgi:hypothetical protein